jgi:hypothetical protein
MSNTTSASGPTADTAVLARTIYDGVDAPPDGINVPKWRC